MCGIGFTVEISPLSDKTHQSTDPGQEVLLIHDSIRHAISPRGPDFRAQTRLEIPNISTKSNIQINFFVSVLHLRGLALTPQPIKARETGSLLLWNGEVFGGLPVSETSNDGQAVLDALEHRDKCTIPEILVGVEGPYAFIYYDASFSQIWFGRDPLGRRSLMMLVDQKTSSSHSLISVASHFQSNTPLVSSELGTESLFYIDVKNLESSLSILQVSRGSPRIHINRQIPLESERVPLEYPDSTCPSSLAAAVVRFRDSLEISLQRRLRSISGLYQADEHQPQVAILFSGGLDCTTLALLAHLYIPLTESIDLINVAFENPRTISHVSPMKSTDKKINDDVFSVPDRHTGEASWKELCQLTPGRCWRFVKVNVWMADYLKYKDQIIELMRPNATVMDLSIAAALFFAARGIGSCQRNSTLPQASCDSIQPYHSPARVFLSGLGADELLGGYSRHRSAFSSNASWINLIDELQLDIDRIPTRNLGRDDRIISHFGREIRYPFLDCQVISVLADLPVHLKCDFRLDKGKGDKLLLRTLAHQLGLKQTSKLAKRAIQFGARSAKLERLEKGTDEVELCVIKKDPIIQRDRACYWNGWPMDSRLRLANCQSKEYYANLERSQEDIRTGHVPASLQLAKISFNSFPVRHTVMLGYSSHIEAARSLASQSHHITHKSKPCYERRHILNKGIAILATQDINPGALILSERPVMILPERLEAPSREILDKVHLTAFDELDYEDQKGIAELMPVIADKDSKGRHPHVNRIWNNKICIPIIDMVDCYKRPYPYSAVYPTISCFNHSSSPNSCWHFDRSSFSLQLTAVRQIEEGEEITVSHIDPCGATKPTVTGI